MHFYPIIIIIWSQWHVESCVICPGAILIKRFEWQAPPSLLPTPPLHLYFYFCTNHRIGCPSSFRDPVDVRFYCPVCSTLPPSTPSPLCRPLWFGQSFHLYVLVFCVKSVFLFDCFTSNLNYLILKSRFGFFCLSMYSIASANTLSVKWTNTSASLSSSVLLFQLQCHLLVCHFKKILIFKLHNLSISLASTETTRSCIWSAMQKILETRIVQLQLVLQRLGN